MEVLLATLAVASISLIGVFLFRNKRVIDEARSPFLPLSVGAFLAVAFFELLPEAFHETEYASIAIAGGFLGFFLLSRLLSEYHHHHINEGAHEHAERGTLVLWGDAVHNFSDGIVIAIAFSISPTLGIATALGVMLHEVPQEIAEFYILLSAGYSKQKAALYNFFSALSVVFGAGVTLLFINLFEPLVGILIGVAAGNILYIAASDLLPEIATHAKEGLKSGLRQFFLVLLGLALISTLLSLTHEREEEEFSYSAGVEVEDALV